MALLVVWSGKVPLAVSASLRLRVSIVLHKDIVRSSLNVIVRSHSQHLSRPS